MKQLLVIITLALLASCAAVPPPTREECNVKTFETKDGLAKCLFADSEYVIKQFKLEEKRVEKRDKLIIFLNACDNTSGVVLVEIRRVGWRSMLPNSRAKGKALKQYGYKYTHDNVGRRAQRHDFVCMDRQDAKRMIERATGGGIFNPRRGLWEQ